MRSFDELFQIAADRKGGEKSLKELLSGPTSTPQLIAIPDDRWLSMMTKCVFQAGFNWRVVNNMWSDFEIVFDGFDIGRCSMLTDEDFERLVADKRIVRHGTKIRSVQHNAMFVGALRQEYGSAGQAFGQWPSSDYVGLLDLLKKRGARLGGNTGQYFLRFMGVDSFILSADVTGRLIAEGIIDKPAGSKSSMRAVQEAFNAWQQQSGRSLSEISRVLAMSL